MMRLLPFMNLSKIEKCIALLAIYNVYISTSKQSRYVISRHAQGMLKQHPDKERVELGKRKQRERMSTQQNGDVHKAGKTIV